MNEITKAELLNLTVQLAAGILAGGNKSEVSDILSHSLKNVLHLCRNVEVVIEN